MNDLKSTNVTHILKLLMRLISEHRENITIRELVAHYLKNDFLSLTLKVLQNTSIRNDPELIIAMGAITKQIGEFHFQTEEHSEQFLGRCTAVLREVDDIIEKRTRRQDTASNTQPTVDLVASYKDLHVNLCNSLSKVISNREMLNGHTNAMLHPEFDHHAWLCYREFGFIPPRKHSTNIYNCMINAHDPRNSRTRDKKIVRTFKFLNKQDPENLQLNFFLGHYYFHKRKPEAVTYLTKCSTKGHLAANYLLGKIHLRGMFKLKRDIPKAIRFFEACVNEEQNDFFAAYRLARLYQDGIQDELPSDSKLMKQYGKIAKDSCPNGNDARTSIRKRFGV